MKKFVIIDGNAIIHRAYHAIPPLTTKDGRIVNAVYGFTSMLLRVWREIKPEYLAVTFDMQGPTFRHEKFTEYKATRVKADQDLYDQVPLVHQLVEAFNIPIYEKKGYEADDGIGTIVKRIKEQGVRNKNIETYIVTGDKDTLQLIDENTKVFTLGKGISDIVTYDAAAVEKRFGFGPERMVDYKALAGDSSDNIPGVPGVGEKTATDLIKNVGGIKEIYDGIKNQESRIKNIVKPAVIKKLIDGEELALMSFELATIDCNVPDLDFNLTNCISKEYDREKVVKIFQEFEFTSLLKRLPGEPDIATPTISVKNKMEKFKFVDLKTDNEIKELIQYIKKEKIYAAKALVNNNDYVSGELRGLAVVVKEKGYFLNPKQTEQFEEIFIEEKIELVGHDLKQLVKVFIRRGVEIKNSLFDVMVASYLLSSGSRAHDVKSIILKELGKEININNQENLFGIDGRVVSEELFLILQTKEKLQIKLVANEDLGLLQKLEMPLIFVLAEMELNGVAVDLKILKKLSTEVAQEIKKVSTKIYKLAGTEFNISSPTQLREVLFEKMNIPVEGIKKGKTGLSTSAEQLEKLRDLHPIIPEIENYRELEKLRNTYIDVLPTLINQTTGRIHTTFNQTVAATGRLSSSEPNLQNIPIRTELGREVRKAFIAEPGNILVSADYSQIELRIVASLAEDKRMMEIFERDEDIHKATAAAINGVPLNEVTKEMRRAAKEINFGVLYGMGTYGLSWRAEIPVWQAKEFIEKYFNEFSGVKKYLDRTLEFTRKEGYCETLFGRRRYIPELHAQNFQLRSAAERMAINHPIQGTAADLIKMAMIAVNAKCKSQNGKFLTSDVRMILQVHDELVFEVKKGQEKAFGEELKKIMEGVVKLRVPVKVEVSYNHSWGEMK